MIRFVLKQLNNPGNSNDGKYYARPVIEETMDLNALANRVRGQVPDSFMS